MSDNATLTEEELAEANAEVGGATEAEFVQANMGLVRMVAARFSQSGVEFEDLCQIGTVGLLKAIRNFDRGRQVAFSTYAVPVILGEIRRFLRDDGPVKVSRSLRQAGGKVRRARQALEQRLGRSPTLGEVCRETGLSPEEVLLAQEATARPVSLDEPRGDGEATVGETVPAPGGDGVEAMDLRARLAAMPPADRTLLALRYFREKTQQETAALLGMTQVQVFRREKKLLDQLRGQLGADIPPPRRRRRRK